MSGYRHLALVAFVLFVLPATASADPPAAVAVTYPPTAVAPPTAPPPAMACCPEGLTCRHCEPLHWWASVEYSFGWINGVSTQPLLVATPVGGTVPTALFTGDNLNGGFRNGFQVRGGFWFDENEESGIDAGMLFLGGLATRGRAGDTPGFVVGRPFLNALTNAPDVQLVSTPGLVSGQARVDAVSSDFWGADVALRMMARCDCRGRLDVLYGYRFLYYGDSVRVTEDLLPTVAPFAPGTRVGVVDSFTAQNQFHGMLFALAGEYRFDSWYIQGRGGVSFGGTFRRATVSGTTSVQAPQAATVVQPGGLLALSSNSGTFSAADWVFMPEASIRVGYQVRENVRLYVGYSFLYWPAVYRAADQIDPVVNPGLVPPQQVPLVGQVRPLFPDRQSGLWMQAVSIGLELRY